MSDQNHPDGNGGPAWTAQLPDDLKGNEYLTQFPKMGDAFKELLEAKSGLDSMKTEFDPMKEELEQYRAKSESMISMPEDETGLDEILGKFAPEKPEDYGVELGDEDPAKDFKEQFLSWAHEQKLPKSKTAAMLSKVDEYTKTQAEQADESRKQALHTATKELEERWGEHYDERVQLADRGLKTFVSEKVLSEKGAQEMKKMINETEFGTSPAVMELFSVIGRLATDDVAIEGDSSSSVSKSDGLEYPSMKSVQ